jgi:hypothetical protein
MVRGSGSETGRVSAEPAHRTSDRLWSWTKESFEIATKIAYRNGGRIGIPKAGAMDCAMVTAAPVLPVGYVVSASRIADRRVILAGYRLADVLTRVVGN